MVLCTDEWRITVWCMECMNSIVYYVEYGPWYMDCDVWTVSCVWTAVYELRVYGLWCMDCRVHGL